MTRLAVGFLLGLSLGALGTAFADSMLGKDNSIHPLAETPIEMYLNAGVGPDNKMAPIRVDENGYVICSDKGPRR